MNETKQYLEQVKEARYPDGHVLKLYMVLGGIPYYLSLIQPHLSVTQNIGMLCFGNGQLAGEFQILFSSLYENSEHYELIVTTLASHSSGLTREEILQKAKLASGSQVTKVLRELEEAGFIAKLKQIGKQKKESIFKLIDEFSLFHVAWIAKAPSALLLKEPEQYWLARSKTPAFTTWSGYAFESVCLKHVHCIQKKLGITGAVIDVGPWWYRPTKRGKTEKGAQIDLVLDRVDSTITLCEMKYSDEPFLPPSHFQESLLRKEEIFRNANKTTKHLSTVLVTPYGVKGRKLVDEVISLEAFF